VDVVGARSEAVPDPAWRVILPIAGVTAVLHCAAATLGANYWFDEVYMLAIGRHHLAWGSADQPPLTPALAGLVDIVAPGSVVALRMPASPTSSPPMRTGTRAATTCRGRSARTAATDTSRRRPRTTTPRCSSGVTRAC